MKRRTKIILVLVLVLVVGVFFLFHGTGSHRRAVEAYKRDLLAKGEKLTVVELAPPATNDPERVKRLVDLMGRKVPSNLPVAMKMIAPGVAAPAMAILVSKQMAGYEQNEKWATELRETLGTQSLRFNLVYSNSVELPSLPGLNSAETMAAGTMIQAICTN